MPPPDRLQLITSDGFRDYALLDCGAGRKLERFGTVVVGLTSGGTSSQKAPPGGLILAEFDQNERDIGDRTRNPAGILVPFRSHHGGVEELQRLVVAAFVPGEETERVERAGKLLIQPGEPLQMERSLPIPPGGDVIPETVLSQAQPHERPRFGGGITDGPSPRHFHGQNRPRAVECFREVSLLARGSQGFRDNG